MNECIAEIPEHDTRSASTVVGGTSPNIPDRFSAARDKGSALKFIADCCNICSQSGDFRHNALCEARDGHLLLWETARLHGIQWRPDEVVPYSTWELRELMLREHINDIRIRWSPRDRGGSTYDPGLYLETPEQARRLIQHLNAELKRAHQEKNTELVREVGEILEKVERLAKRFFRWEERMTRALNTEDLREIKKLPLGF